MHEPDRLTTVLRLSGITKKWAGQVGLEAVSLEVKSGEAIALIGRTGAGKSTLLRLISGLESPDSGRIEIRGDDVRAMLPHERGISMIFQKNVHYPGKSLIQDWQVAMSRGVLDDWKKAGIEPSWVLDALQLSQAQLRQKPETHSGGEARRASVLRALLQNRPLILADEPLTGLDPLTRDHVSRFLWQFVKQSGHTMIVVAHEPVDALGLADRIAVMQTGRIIQTDRPKELLDNPGWREVVDLLHFPPMNDITSFCGSSCGSSNDELVRLIAPQFCTALPHDATSGSGPKMHFLRDRWTSGTIYSEWLVPGGSRVIWTVKPDRDFQAASLHWQPDREIVFQKKSGLRVLQNTLIV